MSFQFEKNKLYAYLGKGLVEALKHHKAYIAGGTITSLFCNREINDIDVYFRDEDSILDFISEIWGDKKWVTTQTKKATLLVYDNVQLQIIHFNYFNSPQDIFDTFDFTSCMGAFDFATEEFVFHEDFMKHNSQRLLKFNSNTAFPIVSLLRVQKYQEKGYYISKPEFIRIVLTCMNLDINTYEELKDQLGGMYGINYDKLFEDVKDEEFNLETAIEKIADITLKEEYFTKPVSVEFEDLDNLLENIATKPVKVFEHKDKLYKVGYNKVITSIDIKPEQHEAITVEDYFNNNKFYKFVRKKDDKYLSFFDSDFEYRIGEEVVAVKKKEDSWARNHSGNLHFGEWNSLKDLTYSSNTEGVLIEVTIKPEDFFGLDGHILAKKCTVIREVPKKEYGRDEDESKGISLSDW